MTDLPSPQPSTDRKRPLWRTLLGVAGLAVLGGLSGYALGGFGHDALGRWDDEIAMVMAFALTAMALISAVVLATRPRDVPKGCGLLQIAVLALAAVMFVLPVFGTRILAPNVVFGLVVGLLAVQSVANLMLWRAADEMLRRVMAETSAMAFWALQTALFVYAVAERLGLVEGITAWGMTGILMGVYLVASIVASLRRGIT
ncbi:MAG: hypothetical protein ACT6RD_13480 [Brevundimonas sp.]|uniref:hypothetical protein n=1 Tax=Brevundimonas sp. TaxID=1871086 RepID=UPI004033960A